MAVIIAINEEGSRLICRANISADQVPPTHYILEIDWPSLRVHFYEVPMILLLESLMSVAFARRIIIKNNYVVKYPEGLIKRGHCG